MHRNHLNNPLVERSKQEALLHAAPMVDRALQGACGAIEEDERNARSVARRLQLADAHAALLRYAPRLRVQFPQVLMRRIEQALREDEQPDHRRRSDSEESILGLLDDAEVARFVEASRLQQSAMPVIERSLGVLDSLMSSVLGLPVVRADLNPFRPDVYCAALLEVLEEQPETPEVRGHWIRHLGRPFAAEMHAAYEALNALLEASGVEEARYRLKLAEGGGGGGGGGAGGGAGSGAGMAPADGLSETGFAGAAGALAAGAVGAAAVGPVAGDPARAPARAGAFMPRMEQLARGRPAASGAMMREFLYRPQWVQEYDEPLPTGYYAAVDVEMAALARRPAVEFDESIYTLEREQRRSQDVMERAARPVGVELPLPPEHWGESASVQARMRTLMQLKARAEKISQVLGLDAVRALINQVAGDERVLTPVREAFVALEPALLRMALDDPRFFGDESHPARVFVEAVAQRSFKYNDEFDAEFEHFMQPVRAAVRELVDLPVAALADFEERRLALQTAWKVRDDGEHDAREQVLHSMQFAQERQTLADRIAWEFSLRSDLVGVPAVVADFLYRDWSLVIAHAQLTNVPPRLDPGGYLAVVSDLLWSVNREQAIKQPARLFEVVPGVLKTLRRGLDMLGKEPVETQAFFDALLRYHAPVLRLRRLRSAQDVEASGFARLGDAWEALPPLEGAAVQAAPRKADQPWLGRHERVAAGFDEAEEIDWLPTAGPTAVDPQPAAPVTAVPRLAEPLEPAADGAVAPAPPADLTESELIARIRTEVARLRQGDWVDLYVHGAWRRAQLSWMSDNGSLFMFVSHGGRAHSMTQRTCEKLMRLRHLHPVEIDPVVARALQRLAQQTGDEDVAISPVPADLPQ